MSFLLSKLGGDIELALLGHDEEVPVAVVHGPVLHGGVTRVHVYRDPVPGLAVTRSCKSSETTLVTCIVVSSYQQLCGDHQPSPLDLCRECQKVSTSSDLGSEAVHSILSSETSRRNCKLLPPKNTS